MSGRCSAAEYQVPSETDGALGTKDEQVHDGNVEETSYLANNASNCPVMIANYSVRKRLPCESEDGDPALTHRQADLEE